MTTNHYYPEQQYMGAVLMADMHPDSEVVYLEIVVEYWPEEGLYLADYMEVDGDGNVHPIVGNWYTADELDQILYA